MADLARTITLGSQRLTVLPRIPDTARRVIDHLAKVVTNSDATQALCGATISRGGRCGQGPPQSTRQPHTGGASTRGLDSLSGA